MIKKKYFWLILAAAAVAIFFYLKKKKKDPTEGMDTTIYVDQPPFVPPDMPAGMMAPMVKKDNLVSI